MANSIYFASRKTLFILFLFLFVNWSFGQETEKEKVKLYPLKGNHNFNIGVGYPNLVGARYAAENVLNSALDLLVTEDKKGYTTPDFTLKYEYGASERIGLGVHLGYFRARSAIQSFETIQQGINSQTGGVLCQIIPELCPEEPGDAADVVKGKAYRVTNAYSVAGRLVYYVPIQALLSGPNAAEIVEDMLTSKKNPQIGGLDTYFALVAGYSFIQSKRVGEEADTQTSVLDDIVDIVGGVVPEESTASFNNIPLNWVYQVSGGVRYHVSKRFAIYGELGYGTLGLLNVGAVYKVSAK